MLSTVRPALRPLRLVALFVGGLACSGCEPPAPHPPVHSQSPTAVPSAAPAPPAPSAALPADPDSDSDGIPDRCDACPGEPGMLWDSHPVIDGCSTGVFHGLVREPEGTVFQIAYPVGSAAPPAAVDVVRVIEILRGSGADSIAVVGRAGAQEPRPAELARERARRFSEALAAGGVQAKTTLYTVPAAAPSVEVAVLSRNGEEELRRVDGRFEHVRAAAARERKARAEGAPSPCGRTPGAPVPGR